MHGLISSQPIANLNSIRTVFSKAEHLEKGLPLSVLISVSERSLATNARDKVYGVMGLVNEDARRKIKIDYDKSVEDLYEGVSRYLICDEGKLNILSNQSRDLSWKQDDGSTAEEDDGTGIGPHSSRQYTIKWAKHTNASWVRDFTRVPSLWVAEPMLRDWHARGVLYRASGMTKPLIVPDQQPGELGICGMQLDVVKECAKAWHTVPGMIQHFASWNGILPLWFRAAQTMEGDNQGPEAIAKAIVDSLKASDDKVLYQPKNGPTKSMSEAIWRTVIGDKLHPDLTSAPSYCGTFFSGLKQSHFSDTQASISLTDGVETLEEGLAAWYRFQERVDEMLFRRAAFRTEDGWIGLAPDEVAEGDVVVILSGGDVPFVLREVGDGGYVLVGECFVEGAMYGDVVKRKIDDGMIPGRLFRIK